MKHMHTFQVVFTAVCFMLTWGMLNTIHSLLCRTTEGE